MMDFDNVLDIASQNQGQSNIPQKRYSLATGPPKKDPKSKGVNPAAVQALLKKQHIDARKKEIEMKKQKDQLLAKRVELKSDRKARAMASRTKDNFRGYNGIPVVDVPKKRRTKQEMQQDSLRNNERFTNPEDDEDNYEYEQTDSEPEDGPEPLRPGRSTSSVGSSSNSKTPLKKDSGMSRTAPTMNFADLLKLAETKQFEPVEVKTKVVKKEERLRTAEEIRELEMERKAKRNDRDRNPLPDRQKASSSSGTKTSPVKEQKNSRSDSGPAKKAHPTLVNNRDPAFSKTPVPDRDKSKKIPNDRDRAKTTEGASSRPMNFKIPQKVASSQASTKKLSGKAPVSNKSSSLSDLSLKKESSSLLQKRTSGIPGSKPAATDSTGPKNPHGRPIQSTSLKQGLPTGSHKAAKGESLWPAANSAVKSNSKAEIRTPSNTSLKSISNSEERYAAPPQKKLASAPLARGVGSQSQSHPGGSGLQRQTPGLGRPVGGGVSRRPAENIASGPGRPKCTVVSETISSKNVGGGRPGGPPRPGMPQRPGMVPRGGMAQRPGMVPRGGMAQRPGMVPRGGMAQRPGMVPRGGMAQRPGMVARGGMPARPMMNRPGTMLPPITSAYKRKYEEEEEYDSEMDDFIEDEDEGQEEISKHIREIFGYDRNKYSDESDYALKFMETSWRDVQKEEARSLRMAVHEDQEEEKRELEELRRNSAKRRKN